MTGWLADHLAPWLEPGFLALAVPGVLFAGVSKGGFGSGASFAATPLVAIAAGPAAALAVLLPVLMVMDVSLLRAYWRGWSGREAGLLVAGAMPGVALGALVWRAAPAEAFGLLIGLVAVGFVAWHAAGRLRGRAPSAGRRPGAAAGLLPGLLAGVAAGFGSFVSHAGGPPAAVYLLSRGLSKTRYQATSVVVFWAVNLAKLAAFAGLGMLDAATLAASLLLAPAALLGARLGVRAHRMVPERAFFAVTYALLLGAGTKLIWDALA